MSGQRRIMKTIPCSGFVTIILACASPGYAQVEHTSPETLPIQMGVPTFLILGGLLLLSMIMYFLFKDRYNTSQGEIKDITGELETTRLRLTETSQKLDNTEKDLKHTNDRYHAMLFEAETGIFQMDLEGNCTYINSATQDMSGLYPKKALSEGLLTAIHPDDRKSFSKAWKTFTEGDENFYLRFRFQREKGSDVHVICKANKVLNEKKKVESYIGWITNVTPFHEEQLQQEIVTSRYADFIDKTIEGYYQLAPENPIPVSSPDKMMKSIMQEMRLVNCNETFAAMYGTTSAALKNKVLNTIPGGCGPFKNENDVKKFVASKFTLINVESVIQDPRGNRLSLLNSVIGIVEDNKLIGIWGSQQNISQEKREKAELANQTAFMRRILNALPADVFVKDTRCRYLYASKKLADRTGIPQENWIGKTVFEVMPATPKEHDKTAIEVMKNGKMSRLERSYETRGKSGWMETIQIPLISEDGLVEGVVGLSFEISERRKREDEIKQQMKQLDHQLQHRIAELQKTQDELGQTAIQLRDSNQKLRIRDAEIENNSHAFQKQLLERDQTEQTLRKKEESLLTRQTQLEELVDKTRTDLTAETQKRKKWEELISIKEDELLKLEETYTQRSKLLEQETAQRKQLEAELKARMAELESTQNIVSKTETEQKEKIDALVARYQKEFEDEQKARAQSEGELKNTNTELCKVQDKIKQLAEKHATELEHEVSERKEATTKLIETSDELDALKHQFEKRIEEETKRLKQEIAEKQIREKALRQHEKDLAGRVQELEKMLNMKVNEHEEQIQAREGAEVQRQQAEQKLEQMTKRQKELVERETQRLNLNIAEIRLDEIKLRTQVGILQEEKEKLEDQYRNTAFELEKANKLQAQTAATLSETQIKLDAVQKDQAAIVAKQTVTMQEELKALKKKEGDLLKEEALLKKQNAGLEDKVREFNEKLTAEKTNRKQVEQELQKMQTAFEAGQKNIDELIRQETRELEQQIAQHKKDVAAMKNNETRLQQQVKELNNNIQESGKELKAAQNGRKKAETEMADMMDRAGKGIQETERMIANLKKEHEAEIQQVIEEGSETARREKHYRSLFKNSALAFLQLDSMKGDVKSANQAAAALFGIKSTEECAKTSLSALSPETQADQASSADMIRTHLHTALEQGYTTFEWTFNKSGCKTFHALVTLSTIDDDKKQNILAAVQDISGIKRRQDDLLKTIEEARAANRMNSLVVDELNEIVLSAMTPVVSSSSSLKEAENLEDQQKKDLTAINRGSRSLIDTMTYRHELTHLDEGGNEVVSEECDLHQMIKDLDQQFCHRAETKKLFFAVSYAQYQSANNLPKMVEADGRKLNKIISILLGYALDHTEKGRLGLHTASHAKSDNNLNIVFELTYTGKKTKDELLDGVFAGEGKKSESEEAMKYGLTIAHRYARLLGCNIVLDYRESDITALTVTCPFKKVESDYIMLGSDDAQAAGAA